MATTTRATRTGRAATAAAEKTPGAAKASRVAAVPATVKVKLVRSTIRTQQRHKDTVRSLGLRRLNQVVEKPDNDQIRGMIHAVRHLVEVVE